MADHEEYRIRSERLKTNPFFKNYKEGIWESPNGTKRVKTVVSYEAEMINLDFGHNWSSSIYPVLWDELFSEWKYLGPK